MPGGEKLRKPFKGASFPVLGRFIVRHPLMVIAAWLALAIALLLVWAETALRATLPLVRWPLWLPVGTMQIWPTALLLCGGLLLLPGLLSHFR